MARLRSSVSEFQCPRMVRLGALHPRPGHHESRERVPLIQAWVQGCLASSKCQRGRQRRPDGARRRRRWSHLWRQGDRETVRPVGVGGGGREGDLSGARLFPLATAIACGNHLGRYHGTPLASTTSTYARLRHAIVPHTSILCLHSAQVECERNSCRGIKQGAGAWNF
jgi:hypothetical protein